MAICNNCGTQFRDNKAFCPRCGEEVFYSYGPDGIYGQTEAQAQTDNFRPGDNYRQGDGGQRPREYDSFETFDEHSSAYVYSPPKDRLPLGVGGFLLSLILMSIPVIGFIIQILWSLGVAKNVNRRNLARAYLIFNIVLLLILGGIIAAIMPTIDMFLSLL